MMWEESRQKKYDMNDECHKEELLVLCAAENLMCDAFCLVSRNDGATKYYW